MFKHAVALFVLAASVSGIAQAQEASARPGKPTRGGADLFFKSNQACLVSPHCQIPASSVFPNPNDYTTLTTLALPAGSYLVTAKLSAFAATGTLYVNFECALLDSTGKDPKDMSSFDGTAEQTLFLQAPVSFHSWAGGTVRVGCRAFGFQPDGVSLVDMHVWNVNIAALQVGSVTAD
jgi:hypothetical protein